MQNSFSAPPRKERRHRLEKLSSPPSSAALVSSPSYKAWLCVSGSSWLRVSPGEGRSPQRLAMTWRPHPAPQPHNSSAVLRVCWSEICDVRGPARVSFCSTLLLSWRLAAKSCPLQAASSLQKKVSFFCLFFLGFYQLSGFLLQIWFIFALIGSVHHLRTCVVPTCRSVPARLRPVHCPPSENHSWWRVHLPLRVSPLQGWAFQAWSATRWFGGAGLLQGQLQGSLSHV